MDKDIIEFAALARSGKEYNDVCEAANKARHRCRQLTRALAAAGEYEDDIKNAIFDELFGSCGKNPIIEPGFQCDVGSNIFIGDNVLLNFDCIILDYAEVHIGNNVLCGPRTGLYTVNHSLDPEKRRNGVCTAKPIVLEDNVWLGGDVKITGGVTIGKNSVIGAGSVVTADIPPNVIAAGVPCKVIRKVEEK